jgi:hypothetical protein
MALMLSMAAVRQPNNRRPIQLEESMQLALCTWQEVEAYLKRSTGIIIPIGSTEQHGPNGLIGTDAICAEVFAREVGKQADAMVAPTISVGMAQHHLAFPGSMTPRSAGMASPASSSSTAMAAMSPPRQPPSPKSMPRPACRPA